MRGYDELLALGRRGLALVLESASNGRGLMTPCTPGLPWGERAVGWARFAGGPFRAVAARAGADPQALEIAFTGADSGRAHGRPVAFEHSLPAEVALHPDTLLATHMNGLPLTPATGMVAALDPTVPRTPPAAGPRDRRARRDTAAANAVG
jgi:DMSO/TMAO reductase YedYZ molybdopterin-dependent catalytic subunit